MTEKAAVIAVAVVLLAGCGGSFAGTQAAPSTVSGVGKSIPLLAAGDSTTIGFTVETPGTHLVECSFHVQLGQVGTMTVSGR